MRICTLALLFAAVITSAGCNHFSAHHADGHGHADGQGLGTPPAAQAPLTEVGIAVPIRSGQTEAWQQAITELTGPRYDEYESSRQRMGITSQTTFLQKTRMGDFAVIHMTGPDVRATFHAMAESRDPWDVKWRVLTESLHGIDFAKGEAVMPTIELAFETSSEQAATNRPYMFMAPIADLTAFRTLASEIKGGKRSAYLESRQRLGIRREAVYLETTGMGNAMVVYWDAPAPQTSLAAMRASTAPFDKWLLAGANNAHGMNLDELPVSHNPLVGQYPRGR